MYLYFRNVDNIQLKSIMDHKTGGKLLSIVKDYQQPTFADFHQ